MTPEQFVFWLSGYVDAVYREGTESNFIDFLNEKIKTVLPQTKSWYPECKL